MIIMGTLLGYLSLTLIITIVAVTGIIIAIFLLRMFAPIVKGLSSSAVARVCEQVMDLFLHG